MTLTQSTQLPLKWKAKDFSLQDTDETEKSLKDLTGKKGLLIVFSCNHCPYAKAAWPLIIDLYHKYKKDIEVVAINPNDEINYPDDSFEQMKVKKDEWNIPFPYLRDETQEVARGYQAQCTPDPYLFKIKDGKPLLFYRGRINDNWQNPEQVSENNLEDAIKLVIADQPPPTTQHPSMGCSIKWKR